MVQAIKLGWFVFREVWRMERDSEILGYEVGVDRLWDAGFVSGLTAQVGEPFERVSGAAESG